MSARPSFRDCVVADLAAWGIPVNSGTFGIVLLKHVIYAGIFYHGFACVFCYRLNVRLNRISRLLARLFGVWRFYTFANDISYYAEIGPGLKINHTTDIVIGKGTIIGRGCSIYNGVTIGAKRFDKPDEKPLIGDDVTIGTGAKVLGKITVGNRAIIGALTLCTVSVPDGALAIGNPVTIKDNYTSS